MRCLAVVCALAIVVGCAPEEPVRVYMAPKAIESNYVILGAMFPADDPKWFFKLNGKEDEITAVTPAFDAFVKSVRFPNGTGNPPVWDLPAGWSEGPARQMRYATVVMAGGKHSISVSQASGGLESNVARWAGQVGAKSMGDGITPLTTSSGMAGKRVLLNGPKNPEAGGMMPGGR